MKAWAFVHDACCIQRKEEFIIRQTLRQVTKEFKFWLFQILLFFMDVS